MISPNDALQQTKNWLNTAVIGLNLCPFANSAAIKNQIRYRVCQTSDSLQLLKIVQEECDYLIQTPATQIDTSLMIMPYAVPQFEDYLDLLYLTEQQLTLSGLDGILQIASFHPQYQFSGTNAEAIENYTNRAPYPIFHFLREESLTQAIDHFAKIDEISQKNQQTMQKIGHQDWQKLIQQILTTSQSSK